ncbi:MAG: type II toxin-antitoxin system RelE/ParE family toxin [Rhizomicrobium sp.]
MIRLIEYVDLQGRNPFARWRAKLDDVARARVTRALLRLADGSTSNLKGVGGGVVELKIDFGPGYRVYLAWDGPVAVVLFGGGTKNRQQADIEAAHERWTDYKRRSKQGER